MTFSICCFNRNSIELRDMSVLVFFYTAIYYAVPILAVYEQLLAIFWPCSTLQNISMENFQRTISKRVRKCNFASPMSQPASQWVQIVTLHSSQRMVASLFKLRHASLSLQISWELLGCLPLLLFFVVFAELEEVSWCPKWLFDVFDVILQALLMFWRSRI